MTVWNVKPIYYGDGKVRYTVLPHNLIKTAREYLDHPTKYDFKLFVEFLVNCRFSEESARKYADYKSRQHDIEW